MRVSEMTEKWWNLTEEICVHHWNNFVDVRYVHDIKRTEQTLNWKGSNTFSKTNGRK